MTSDAARAGANATTPITDRARNNWIVLASVVAGHLDLLIVAISALLVTVPLIGTPYVVDDLINSQIPVGLARGRMTRWHYFSAMNDSWMYHYGRFFPGATAYATAVFTTFTTRLSYKLWLLALLVLLILAIGCWTHRSLGHKSAAIFAVSALLACWQFRYTVSYDGLTSFAGLIPWTMLLTTTVALLLSRRPRRGAPLALAVAVVAWSATVMTYEYSIILAPAVIAGLWLIDSDKRWRRWAIVTVVGPALLEIGVSSWLQVHKHGPSNSEYILNLKLVPLVEATAKELVAALPLSQYWVPGPSRPSLHIGLTAAIAVTAIAVILVAVLYTEWHALPVLPRRKLMLTPAIGAWMWVTPALLMGATLRWQAQIAWGQFLHSRALRNDRIRARRRFRAISSQARC